MKFPSDWRVVHLKDIIEDMQPGFAQRPGEEDGSIGQIRTHNVTPDGQISLEGLKRVSPSEAELRKYSLEQGDIVFNNTNSEEWVGKTALYDHEELLVFSNHMTRIRVNQKLVLPAFLARYLHFLWNIGFSKTRAKRWVNQAGIDQNELSEFKVPLPTTIEQQHIIDILKQTEVLRCLRRNTSEEASKLSVALFLEMFGDPNPRVNSRWPTDRLGNVAKVETGGTPSRTREGYYTGEILWVKSTELIDKIIYSTEERITEKALQSSNAKLFPVDTILLAMYGQGQTRGRTGKLAMPAACNQACAAISPSQEILPDFLFIWLQCSYEAVRSLGRGGQQANLNLSIVRDLKIPTPPKDKQVRFFQAFAEIQQQVTQIKSAAEDLEYFSKQAMLEAFMGELTYKWRKKHIHELKKAKIVNNRGKVFGFTSRPWVKKVLETIIPSEDISMALASSDELDQLARVLDIGRFWLWQQLSEIQKVVLQTFVSKLWENTLIPAEDLYLFCGKCPQISHMEDAHDQIKRALNQLAGLGLIAKISLPDQAGGYVTGYRALREEELTWSSDLQRLNSP